MAGLLFIALDDILAVIVWCSRHGWMPLVAHMGVTVCETAAAATMEDCGSVGPVVGGVKGVGPTVAVEQRG